MIGMSGEEQAVGALRILFFGLPAGASAQALHGLLSDGQDVVGVVVPEAAVPHLTPQPAPPVAVLAPPAGASIPLGDNPPSDTLNLAWNAGLPVLAVRDFEHPQALAALAELRADVAVVACFTRRIPAAMLRLPRLGFLNLHPSLLPAYRGSSPLFWQLRDGAATGVTIHYLDENLDTGDIAAQAAVSLPDGISGPDADRLLTGAGLELLRGVLRDLARGVVRRRPQPPSGSYQGRPQPEDFALSTDWPARRAFNFMRGTAEWGIPYTIALANDTVRLAVADSYNYLELDRPSVRHGRSILIRFTPGILYARMV
jgi:methionyl-tRNA formyltransferase